MFKELKKGTTSEVEATFVKEWEDEDLLEQTIEHRKMVKSLSFMMDQQPLMVCLVFIIC